MNDSCFEDFRVDKDNFRLTRNQVPVPLEPLVFDLLVVLVEHAGKVVTKDEIIERVWDGRFVSDSTVSTAVKALRKALDDDGSTQRLIRTVRGRGFEFLGKVQERSEPVSATTTSGPQTPAPDPAILVRVSTDEGDPSTHIQARALGARLRTIVGRIPLLRVMAPAGGTGDPVGLGDLRTRLGVTLVAELFLVRTGEAVGIEAALIDTKDEMQVWSRSYAPPLEDLGSDRFLHQLIRHLEPAIVRAMVAGISAGSEEDPRALLLRAVSLLSQKGWRADTFREAEALLEQAVGTDPSLALAHANLALIRALGHRLGITRHDDTVVRRAIAAAERAMDLETQDSMTLGLAGCAFADVGEVKRALPILERAVETDPDNGHAKTALGAAMLQMRDFDQAEAFLEDGISISPADGRLAVWCTIQAIVQLQQGKIDAAEASLNAAVKEDFRLYMPHVGRIALAMAKEDHAAAETAARECVRIRPDISKPELIGLIGQRAGDQAWALIEAQMNA